MFAAGDGLKCIDWRQFLALQEQYTEDVFHYIDNEAKLNEMIDEATNYASFDDYEKMIDEVQSILEAEGSDSLLSIFEDIEEESIAKLLERQKRNMTQTAKVRAYRDLDQGQFGEELQANHRYRATEGTELVMFGKNVNADDDILLAVKGEEIEYFSPSNESINFIFDQNVSTLDLVSTSSGDAGERLSIPVDTLFKREEMVSLIKQYNAWREEGEETKFYGLSYLPTIASQYFIQEWEMPCVSLLPFEGDNIYQLLETCQMDSDATKRELSDMFLDRQHKSEQFTAFYVIKTKENEIRCLQTFVGENSAVLEFGFRFVDNLTAEQFDQLSKVLYLIAKREIGFTDVSCRIVDLTTSNNNNNNNTADDMQVSDFDIGIKAVAHKLQLQGIRIVPNSLNYDNQLAALKDALEHEDIRAYEQGNDTRLNELSSLLQSPASFPTTKHFLVRVTPESVFHLFVLNGKLQIHRMHTFDVTSDHEKGENFDLYLAYLNYQLSTKEEMVVPVDLLDLEYDKPTDAIEYYSENDYRELENFLPLTYEDLEGEPQATKQLIIELVKRTYQPNVLRKKRKHGFRKRLQSPNGRNILKRRRKKGRKNI